MMGFESIRLAAYTLIDFWHSKRSFYKRLVTSMQQATKRAMGFSAARREAVERAFNQFDHRKTGLVELELLVSAYHARCHPHVTNGDLAPCAAKDFLVQAFTPSAQQHGGKVAWEDFLMFHEKMSTEVDLMREKDLDGYFVSLVSSLWGVGLVRLIPTGIVPVTLDVPTGLLATRKMHLIWMDVPNQRLVGFKSVVLPTFARKDLPEALRGYFAFQEEIEHEKVTFLPPQSAIQAPFSIVWEGNNLSWSGIREVITSNCDLSLLPSFLRRHVLTSKEAVAKQNEITFISAVAAKAVNPTYMTSNSRVGLGVDAATAKIQEEKRLAATGAHPAVVYAGRAGSFTASFAGGMPKASGLNFTVQN